MARLACYYGLCPLIDHRKLLGINEGRENGTVVVTLDNTMAIKYKLSDQKQLQSWRSKDKFSSPILFDKEQAKYVAVFSQTFVRFWDSDDDENLDKLKKIKFNQQINTVFVCDAKTFIVFNNGYVGLLKETLEERKNSVFEGVLEENQTIDDVIFTCLNGDVYVGLVVGFTLLWTRCRNGKWEKSSKIELKRKNCELNGHVFHIENQSVHFLSLWSDGQIRSTPLTDPKPYLFMVVSAISCKNYVSMASLDENYIALYGNNCNEEGALLVVHNVQFNVIQSRQPFKMFTNGAKLWRIDSNLLLPVGQNLAVVPFHLATEQMGALIGSHKIDPNLDVAIVQKMTEASWTKSAKRKHKKQPNSSELKQIQDFVNQGFSEEQVTEFLLPELLGKNDLSLLKQVLEIFRDVPEKYLAKILKFLLNSTNLLEKPFSGRIELIDSVLNRNFSESLFLTHLRTELSLSNVQTLLEYICYFLNGEHCLDLFNFTETQQKLTQWICVLLDSNYQKFLLSKDEETKQLLLLLNKLVEDEMSCLNNLKEIAPILNEIEKGKSIYKSTNMDSLIYCVEDLRLF